MSTVFTLPTEILSKIFVHLLPSPSISSTLNASANACVCKECYGATKTDHQDPSSAILRSFLNSRAVCRRWLSIVSNVASLKLVLNSEGPSPFSEASSLEAAFPLERASPLSFSCCQLWLIVAGGACCCKITKLTDLDFQAIASSTFVESIVELHLYHVINTANQMSEFQEVSVLLHSIARLLPQELKLDLSLSAGSGSSEDPSLTSKQIHDFMSSKSLDLDPSILPGSLTLRSLSTSANCKLLPKRTDSLWPLQSILLLERSNNLHNLCTSVSSLSKTTVVNGFTSAETATMICPALQTLVLNCSSATTTHGNKNMGRNIAVEQTICKHFPNLTSLKLVCCRIPIDFNIFRCLTKLQRLELEIDEDLCGSSRFDAEILALKHVSVEVILNSCFSFEDSPDLVPTLAYANVCGLAAQVESLAIKGNLESIVENAIQAATRGRFQNLQSLCLRLQPNQNADVVTLRSLLCKLFTALSKHAKLLRELHIVFLPLFDGVVQGLFRNDDRSLFHTLPKTIRHVQLVNVFLKASDTRRTAKATDKRWMEKTEKWLACEMGLTNLKSISYLRTQTRKKHSFGGFSNNNNEWRLEQYFNRHRSG